MPASVDTDPNQDFWQVAQKRITPSFLIELGRMFSFDGESERANFFILKAAALYVRGRRAEDTTERKLRKAELMEVCQNLRFLDDFLVRDRGNLTLEVARVI